MKRARQTSMVGVTVFFLSVMAIMLAGITAVWLTSEALVFGLVVLPAAIVAGLLVVYFEWRANLRRVMTRDDRDYRKAA